MRRRLLVILAVALCQSLTSLDKPFAFAQGFTDIHLKSTPDHEVRYTSGKTIYVEGLVEGRWVGRYWTPTGRINVPTQRWTEDAFELQVKDNPHPSVNPISLSGGWKWVSGVEAPKTDKGARHFVVELSRDEPSVTVRVHTLVDGTPVLTRWLEITNKTKAPLALITVSPWSGRLWPTSDSKLLPPQGPDHAYTLGYFTLQEHEFEGWFEWKPLPGGNTLIQDLLGLGFDDPFFIVRNEAMGQYFIGHLAWSANWRMEFECEQAASNSGLKFRIGPSITRPDHSFPPAQRVLAPGETVQTPAVHLGHIEGDLDATVQAMHDHLRRTVLPTPKPERAYRVQYGAPGDNGYMAEVTGDPSGMNEANILQHIDIAAAVGAEVFIVDAGWWDTPGDWLPSPSRFPRGLEPIVAYAHKKGLLFGLYVEIERVNAWNVSEDLGNSKVAREHPDWVGPKAILDLSKPEVAAYVESELTRIIERYKLDLYRLDFNPFATYEGPITERQGFRESHYWRYYEAFYGMFERLRAKYPDLILQQCAAGGGRNDLGTASRFHESQVTDGNNMPRVLQIYTGQTLALPPEALIHPVAEGDHMLNGSGYNDTLLRNTFTLSIPWINKGVAPSFEELAAARRERYLHYANLYKRFMRPILPTAKMYHHAPVSAKGGVTSSGWFAMEYAAPDRSKGWATIARIGTSDSDTYLFKPRGLDRGKTYRVTFDSTGEEAVMKGIELTRDGLAIRLESTMASELLLFEMQ
jgi:alpha-galactosidase